MTSLHDTWAISSLSALACMLVTRAKGTRFRYRSICKTATKKLITIRYSQTPDEIQITCHVCIWNSFLLIYYTKICPWHYIICYPPYSLQTTQSRTIHVLFFKKLFGVIDVSFADLPGHVLKAPFVSWIT